MTENPDAGRAAARSRSRWGWGLTALGALFIAAMTLRPAAPEILASPSDSYLLTDLLLNVVLFLPLGIGLGLLGVAPLRALLIAGLASAAIEGTQWRWIPGRDASFLDVLSNGAGAYLGAVLAAEWHRRARWWSAVGPVTALLALAAWCLGTTWVRPSYPPAPRWWGQWAHVLGGTVPFPGRVLSFSLDGTPVPDGPLPEWRTVAARAAAADSVVAEATVVSGGPVRGRAQVVGLVTQRGAEILGVWQEGTRLVGRWRLGMTNASLRTPVVWLEPEPLPAVNDTFRIRFTATRRSLALMLSRQGEVRGRVVPLAPELAWTGLVPYEYRLAGGAPWLPLLGLAILFVLIGAGLTRHPATMVAAGAAGLLFGPLAAGTAPPGAPACLAGTLALIGGWALGRRLRL